MKVTIEQKRLDTFLKAASKLVDEARIRCNEDGWSITAADPSNVAMVQLELPQSGFETYSVDNASEEDTILGVMLGRMNDIVGLASSSDLIDIEITQRNMLNFHVDGLEYNMALIDPDSIRSEPEVADIPTELHAEIDNEQFSRAITAGEKVSDNIELIGVNENGGTLEYEASGDSDDVSGCISGDDIDVISEPSEIVSSILSLDYLRDINRAFDNKEKVYIELGDEFPVTFRQDLGEDEPTLEFTLAPRIQDS